MNQATSPSRWTPHVTVATLVEKDDKFLLVREQPDGKIVYNQPAGHLDEGEGIIEAARRETLEETAWDVEITGYLGVYRSIATNGITYLRHGFIARPLRFHEGQILDEPIIDTSWMSYDDIVKKQEDMRSPMVKQLIDDYYTGLIYPLTLFHED